MPLDSDEVATFWPDLNTSARLYLLEQLQRAHYLEEFLAGRYPNAKTFGLAGSEKFNSWISLYYLPDVGLVYRHRVRNGPPWSLNVLMNILGKSMGTVCTEFNEVIQDDSDDAKLSQLQLGDVKYHLGASGKCSLTL